MKSSELMTDRNGPSIANCRQRILTLLLCGLFVSATLADHCPCTIEFTSPDDNEEFSPTAGIACAGTSSGTSGSTVRIRLLHENGTTIEDSEIVNTSSTGGWNHTFTAPQGGWSENVTKIEAKLYHGDGSPAGVEAVINISIIEQGGGGG